MKTLFLFPQFNYMAPKEEAYFKMQGPEDLPASKMKEATNRWVPEAPSCFFCCFFFLRPFLIQNCMFHIVPRVSCSSKVDSRIQSNFEETEEARKS